MSSAFVRIEATAQMEYRLWWRNRLAILRLLSLLTLAAILVPAPHAAYAILGFRSMGVTLDADTGMVAGGLVLGVAALVLLSFWVGTGLARDAQLRVASYLRTYRSHSVSLLLGRYIAANAIALSVGGAALAMLSATLFWRNGQPPSATAVLLGVAIAVPPLTASAFIGAFIDLTGVQNLVAKVAMVFALWMLIVAVSIGTPFDILGVKLVNEAMFGLRDESALSFGILSTSNRPTLSWTEIRAVDPVSLWLRIGIAAAIVAAGIAMLLPVGGQVGRRAVSRRRGRHLRGRDARAVGDIGEIIKTRPRAGFATAAACMLVRFLVRSHLSVALFFTALLCNCFAATGGVGRSLALTGVLLLFGNVERRELQVAATLERTEAALIMPSAAVMLAVSISVLLLLIDLPCWSYLPALQAAAMACGTIAVTFWLVLTTRHFQTPLLGVGVTGALIYVLALNNVPAGADILGLRHQSLFATATIAVIAVLLVSRALTLGIARAAKSAPTR